MSESSLYGLSDKTIFSLKSVFSKYPEIKKVLLYGSRAKGSFKSGSDIDLTLVAPDLTLTKLLHIQNQIEDLMLAHKVDLSLFHKIENQDLLDHIQRVGVEF